jgi:succinyl-CoA synthetase beta subunit
MKFQEYQGKEIFRPFGMVTRRRIPVFSVDKATEGIA